MWGRKTSGAIGMAVGGAWFLANIGRFSEEGVAVIAMPIIIFLLGISYFFKRSPAKR